MGSQFRLLAARRFLPLFATQTLGAFNDNLFKSAFIMLVTYSAAVHSSFDPAVLSAIAGGALIAPFFLFSALAGELADCFERARLLQILKAAELAAVLGAAAALFVDSLALSFFTLFMLGTQAAFSSPVRYALLPQHLAAEELVGGNGLLEGGTFLSILFGTIAGSITAALDYGTHTAGLLLVLCALVGFLASLFVPRAPPPSPNLRLSRNPVAATAAILRQAAQRRDVRLSILGASWFWLVGAVFLSQLPAFAKTTLGAGSGVVTLFLAAFSIGVGVGSVLCGRLMRGEVSARYVPVAALGMAVFSLDLALASEGARPSGATDLLGILAFLSRGVGIRIFLDLLAIAICGGIFVVPLYAIIQRRSEEAARARTIAAGNIMNALFMTAAAIVSALLLAAGLKTPDLYLVLGLMNAGVALWICRLLPQDTLRLIGRLALGVSRRFGPKRLPNCRPLRFAAAERIATAACPDYGHAVVALPDERRGERLVLVTEAPVIRRDSLVEAAHREGLPEIAVPRDVVTVAALPLLGSGKADYPAVQRLAVQGAPAASAEPSVAGVAAG